MKLSRVARASALSCASWCAWWCLCAVAQAAEPAETRSWHFEVRLDGEPVGEHRFELRGREEGPQVLRSEARFDVRLLGVPVYRYRHSATEQWRDGCLQSLSADTEEGGRRQQVRALQVAGGLQVQAAGADTVLPGCVMSFAYWHPAMRRQSQLLNPQTGALEAVRIERADDAELPVHGRPVPARRWRLLTPGHTIDLWTDARDGGWIGLDAELAGGRRLSYRIP